MADCTHCGEANPEAAKFCRCCGLASDPAVRDGTAAVWTGFGYAIAAVILFAILSACVIGVLRLWQAAF